MYSEKDLDSDSIYLSNLDVQFSINKQNDVVSSSIQGHSDVNVFLKFAQQSLTAELLKSANYQQKMNSVTLPHSNTIHDIDEKSQNISKLTNSNLDSIISLLPLCLQVSEIMSYRNSILTTDDSSNDSSLKQLRKDVERDLFEINGVFLKGHEEKLTGICSTIISATNSALVKCCLSPIEKALENEFTFEILRKASRTNSG